MDLSTMNQLPLQTPDPAVESQRGGGGGGTAQCPRHTRHTNAKRKATSMRPSGRLIYEAAAAPIKAKTATGIRLKERLSGLGKCP